MAPNPHAPSGWAMSLILCAACGVGAAAQPEVEPYVQTQPAAAPDGDESVQMVAEPASEPGDSGTPAPGEAPATPSVEGGGEEPSANDGGTDSELESNSEVDAAPGVETCNGLDDDADGEIDEGLGELQCGEGACTVIVPACVEGQDAVCTPSAGSPESCNGIDDDCDGLVDEDLRRDCNSACGSGLEACSGGVWLGCTAPAPEAERCDLADNDCNGAVDDALAGCRVGVHRSYNGNSGEHFYTTSASEAECCGFTLEAADYFFIYTGPHPGLVGLQRCLGGNGFHHYTTDPACEGLTLEGTIGYVAPSPLAGARPLYRSFFSSGDHFFTINEAEHRNAVASGAADEGIAAYVW